MSASTASDFPSRISGAGPRSRTGAAPSVFLASFRVGIDDAILHGQDLTAQRQGLADLGVQPDRVHVDHGISGIHRARPGLREALAACRTGSV